MGRALRLLAAGLCLLLAVLILIAAGLPDRAVVGAVVPIQPGQVPIAPEIGGRLPPIQGQMPDSAPFMLRLPHDRPIVVNFWASWCVPCRDEMPILEALRDEALIIGVNAGESPETARAFAETLGVTFPLVMDIDGGITRLYRVFGLPTTFVADRDGLIRQVIYGPFSPEMLRSLIQSARESPR